MEIIKYQYRHSRTVSTTGYFSCEPEPLPGLGKLAALLLERPLDTFLRRHALERFSVMPAGDIAALFAEQERATGLKEDEVKGVLASLLYELDIMNSELDDEREPSVAELPLAGAAGFTPLLSLRRSLQPDAGLHAAWAARFAENIHGHRTLPPLADIGLPPLFAPVDPGARQHVALDAALAVLRQPTKVQTEDSEEAIVAQAASAAETAALALERLEQLGVLAGSEQRHEASLSPIALLLPWKIEVSTRCGRNAYTLSGQANTYGRGLSLDQARVSCRMEMVERRSAYLSVDGRTVLERAQPLELEYGTLSELRRRASEAFDVLDPNIFYLEAPYRDEPLYWLPGRKLLGSGNDGNREYAPVWLPFQMVSLFSNLDEIDLCSAPGSTGLATGSSMEQAKLAALTEILERDAEATTLYDKARCFTLEADAHPQLAVLLEDYARLGINVQFMDMTGPLGMPCYQCFVVGPKGGIHRGHGAGLSGLKAIVSALTETPYPYPGGGPSGPRLRGLPARKLSELPDYSRGSAARDLELVEALLCANWLNPVYVDLTHAGLRFPVVRAFISGVSPSADFDSYSRISPRLFRNYLDYRARRGD